MRAAAVRLPSRTAGAMRARLQRIGAFLAGMVIPNIGAFIAWGLITALFVPSGWLPNERLARLVAPMVSSLLPLLIGFSGGRLVHGTRGGVVGAVATMGVIVGSSIPMFIGAMVMGPLGGWAIKRLDRLLEQRVPVGFEMLVANFSAGLVGMTLAIAGFTVVEPVVGGATRALGAGARWLAAAGLLPLLALLVEPGKVMFMNNAINHGVLAPLGVHQVREAGQSVFFLLESNPGPGLGLLCAYWLFGHGAARQSSPGAIVIHFFGGIHEIYFPYILMKPLTLVAVTAGGLAANAAFLASGAGLVATPSPGSIFAQIAMTPRGGLLPVLLGIAVGALCSCLVAMPIVRRTGAQEDAEALDEARAQAHRLKAASAAGPTVLTAVPSTIVFACEAGMGSSVMGASILRRKLEDAGLAVKVGHATVRELGPGAEVVLVHASLALRAREAAPRAVLLPVEDFINSPVYDALVTSIQKLGGR